MVTSKAETVVEYMAELPDDRRPLVKKVRALVRRSLPKGYKELMQYGMISWVVPSSRCPKTYNNQPLAICSLASQKANVALYLMGVYSAADKGASFTRAWQASGKKLNMGKSCLRFKSYDDLAIDVLAKTLGSTSVADFIARHEASRS